MSKNNSIGYYLQQIESLVDQQHKQSLKTIEQLKTSLSSITVETVSSQLVGPFVEKTSQKSQTPREIDRNGQVNLVWIANRIRPIRAGMSSLSPSGLGMRVKAGTFLKPHFPAGGPGRSSFWSKTKVVAYMKRNNLMIRKGNR